ncbi:MAG TPA: PadR family transcriptional regulator, partial [Chloroflexota bacterium]|nr:PadR family transcriptional regulator [Chloroflexota bacterium]
FEVAILDVAVQLAAEGRSEFYGYRLSEELKARKGLPVVGYSTLYRALHRLVEFRLLEERWEDPAARESSRPPRRFYHLTAAGQAALIQQSTAVPTFRMMGVPA